MPLPSARPSALLAALGVTLGLLLVPVAASAADRVVDASTGTNVGTCGVTPCKTIAYAILWSASGDRILVHPGTYSEQVTIGGGKSLVASGGVRPTIDGGAGTAVSVTGPGVRLEGLRLRGDTNAVSVSGAADDTVVQDNVFDDPAANDNGKVAVANGDVTITGNAFTADPQVNSGIGVSTYTGGTAEIGGNTFAGFFSAVRVASNPSHPASVHDNVISGVHSKTPSIGWGIHATGSASLTGNTVTAGAASGTASGVSLNDQGGVAAVTTTRRNRVSGFAVHGIYAATTVAGSAMTFVGDVITGNGSGLSLYNGKPTIRGATIVDNADREIYLGNATTPLKLVSSIVGDKGVYAGGSSCTITFSRGPSTAGSSCQQFQTSAAPGFAAPGDYHLTAASPLLDVGDTGLPLVGETDVDGHPRALVGLLSGACKTARRDIGALEYAPDPAITCPVDPGPLPSPENPVDPPNPADPADPGTPAEPGTPDAPSDPGTPAEPGAPGDPDVPQTPGMPQAPPAHGAIAVVDDQGKAIALTLDGKAAGTLAGHAVGTARTAATGPHVLRVAGARGSRAKAITAKVTLRPGQLAVVVVTAKRGRLVARTTSVAAGARRVLSLLPGAPKVRLGTAKARTLRHGAFASLPSAATSVTVARQRLAAAPGAQLTVLVPRQRRAATVVRAA